MRKLCNNCLFFDKYRDTSMVICSIFIIILFIIFLLISFFIKFKFITSYSGIVVKEDEFYVNLVLDDNGIQWLQKTYLLVDKERKDYSIVKISDEFYLTDKGPMRYVYLKFDIDDDKKIVNNVLKINFVYKSTIFNKLKEMVK